MKNNAFTMTTSHLIPDYRQQRPTSEQVEEMLSSLVITPLPPPRDKKITAYLDSIRNNYVNGGAIFYQFQIQGDTTFNYFASRNVLDQTDFINRVLLKPFRKTAKELICIQPIPKEHLIEKRDIFHLPGFLAGITYEGGAYSSIAYSAAYAFRIALNFVDAISEKKYADFNYWYLGGEWSLWFRQICWDYSVFLFDKRTSIVTVLCMTDED